MWDLRSKKCISEERPLPRVMERADLVGVERHRILRLVPVIRRVRHDSAGTKTHQQRYESHHHLLHFSPPLILWVKKRRDCGYIERRMEALVGQQNHEKGRSSHSSKRRLNQLRLSRTWVQDCLCLSDGVVEARWICLISALPALCLVVWCANRLVWLTPLNIQVVGCLNFHFTP